MCLFNGKSVTDKRDFTCLSDQIEDISAAGAMCDGSSSFLTSAVVHETVRRCDREQRTEQSTANLSGC